MTRVLIALTGYKTAGKSLVARRLRMEHDFTTLRFTDAPKAMLTAGLGLTEEELSGPLKDVPLEDFGGQTPRELTDSLGYRWGRQSVHTDIWVRRWRLAFEASEAERIVVDDLRFPNEAMAVRKAGFGIWRVERPRARPSGAPTERQIADLPSDQVVPNDGGTTELFAFVDELVRGLLEAR